MFDKTKVETGLSGLVGYRPSLDPSFFTLNTVNLQSDSGYYVNDNPFAEIEAYKDTVNYANIDEASFNTKLSQLTSSATTSVCNAVFEDKDNPSFVDRQMQFKNATNKVNLETLPIGFVGEKICIDKKNSLAVEITRIQLDFSGTGDLTLYLYNTNSIEPIKTQVVTIASDHQEIVLNWRLDNTDGINGGDWYVGYYTSGLAVTPYKRDYSNSSYESNITFVDLEKTEVINHLGPNIWDLNLDAGMSETTGMNLDISVYYDYTDLIIQNKFLFADAINLEAAIKMLNQFKGSFRSNKNQRMSSASLIDIETAIEGQTSDKYTKVTGLRPSLGKQLELIKRKIDALRFGYRTGRIKTIVNV
tara:strand:+ start:2012 stop:3091 length:1080 start_codon:yes stop_codon:yes gene_type:complete